MPLTPSTPVGGGEMHVRVAETPAKRLQTARVEMLVTKEHHEILEQRLADRIYLGIADCPAQVDTVNLGPDGRGQRLDANTRNVIDSMLVRVVHDRSHTPRNIHGCGLIQSKERFRVLGKYFLPHFFGKIGTMSKLFQIVGELRIPVRHIRGIHEMIGTEIIDSCRQLRFARFEAEVKVGLAYHVAGFFLQQRHFIFAPFFPVLIQPIEIIREPGCSDLEKCELQVRKTYGYSLADDAGELQENSPR